MGKNATTEHINEEMNKFSPREKMLKEIDAEQRLGVDRLTSYVEADAFIGNPYALLGQVIVVRKTKEGPCPESIFSTDSQAEFNIAPIIGGEEDLSARLNAPVQRSSIIVNKQMTLNISFLTFLSSQLQGKDSFSLVIFDEAAGLIKMRDRNWINAVNAWKQENADLIADPTVCYIFAVTGFIQKNIIKKRFTEFQVGAKAGAYGVNLDGKLYTSTEDFSLDIRFGLTPGIIKRPAIADIKPQAKSAVAAASVRERMEGFTDEITPKELALFASLKKVTFPKSN